MTVNTGLLIAFIWLLSGMINIFVILKRCSGTYINIPGLFIIFMMGTAGLYINIMGIIEDNSNKKGKEDDR